MSYLSRGNNSNQSANNNRNWPVAVPLNPLCTPEPAGVESVNNFYDHVAAHLNGVAKVLKPMLEINNIILNERQMCKSDDHSKRGKSSIDSKIRYYTPQRITSTTKRSNNSNELLSDKYQSCKCSDKSSRREPSRNILNTRSSNFTRSTFDPMFEAHSSTVKLQSQIKINCFKPKFHRELKNCSLCGLSIDIVRIISLLPCKHVFCSSCVSKNTQKACPKCTKLFKQETITKMMKN